MYFDPATFRSPPNLTFVDGALHCNNPVHQAMWEKTRQTKTMSHREIGCVVSLGTGVPKLSNVPSNLATFLQRIVEMMTNADTTTKHSARREGRQLKESGGYFRFSVPQGMDEIELDEHEKRSQADLAHHYLSEDDTGEEIERCSRVLLHPDVHGQ